MGKIILADGVLQTNVDSFVGRNIGLILGQVTPNKDYAVHLVRTPNPESESSDVSSQGKFLTTALDAVDDVWIATHALQVKRMLPGGLEIIGVFVCGSPDALKNAQVRLRQVLYAVFKALNKKSSHSSLQSLPERHTVQICTVTKKLTCRTFDVTDPKSAAKPAEWKYQNVSERWQQLDACLSLNLILPISHDSLRHNLEKQLLSHLEPTFDNIWNSLALIGNQVLDDKELVIQSSQLCDSSKKGKKHKADDSRDNHIKPLPVTLYHQVSAGPQGESQHQSCGAKVLIRGSVRGRAYTYSKGTAGDVIKALKADLIDSLKARCELLCEDMLQSEEEQDPKVLYETPVRVFTALRDTGLCLCDYMFVDESAKDSSERFRDLMDYVVEEEDINRDWESIPDGDDLIKPVREPLEKREGSQLQDASPLTSATQHSSNITGLVLGGAMAAIAALMSYMYLDYD